MPARGRTGELRRRVLLFLVGIIVVVANGKRVVLFRHIAQGRRPDNGRAAEAFAGRHTLDGAGSIALVSVRAVTALLSPMTLALNFLLPALESVVS